MTGVSLDASAPAAADSRDSRAPRRRFRPAGAVIAIPVGCAAAYLLMVVAHFHRIIDAVHLNPDAAWAPVLVRDLSSTHGGQILVGTAPHFTTIWFLDLTRWIPFRDAIWDATPFLSYLVGLGLIAWACWRVAGRGPALLTFAIAASANAAILLTVMSEGLRVNTYIGDAVLAAFLVYWVTRPAGHRWLPPLVVVAVTLLIGTTAASDPLFLASGLGPFLAAPIVHWVLRRNPESGRMALTTTGMSAAGLAVAAAVSRWMAGLGYRKTYETGGYALAAGHVAVKNLQRFGRQLRSLGNGAPSTLGFGPSNALHALMGLLLIGAVVMALVLVFQSIRTRREWSGAAGRTGDGRFLYVTFWVMSALAVCAAFSLSSFAQGPSDLSRYVAPAFFALAATAPLWAARPDWRRITVSLAAALYCVLSIINVGQSLTILETAFRQTAQQGPFVVDYLRSQGVTTGYTGYFDSHPLTLKSGMGVHFYPVVACRAPVSTQLCPLYVNTRSSWYLPRPHTPSFLLFDIRTPRYIAAAPTPELGAPAKVRQFGSLFVYIYDYDLATKLAPPCPTNTLTCPGVPTSASLTHPVADQVGVATPSSFTWTAVAGASQYYLVVGTTRDGKDLVDSGLLAPSQHSYAVPALPPGKQLYASLLTEFGGTWASQAITFTAR